MATNYRTAFQHGLAWVGRAEHRAYMRNLWLNVARVFTQHPHDTGESYLQHLWFTLRMATRLFYTLLVLMIHGFFPFLLTRAASMQIEVIYRIIKTRIPQSRREAIDADIDYHV